MNVQSFSGREIERAHPALTRAHTIVATPDRTLSDRLLDGGRRPAELLAFLGVDSGMRVAELVADRGYTAELLARAVAPHGIVYAQNPRCILDRVDAAWSHRLLRPAMKPVSRVDRELDAPLPHLAKGLDLVVMNRAYHDTVWFGVDRDAMNRAVLAALKNGGTYVVIDHSARAGRGLSDARTLHRVDEDLVQSEIERAGFRMMKKGAFLRNVQDARDWSAAPGAAAERRGASDRFALVFVK
jgi:predicted methyltransferase